MAGQSVCNQITGGIFFNAVIQGQYVTVQLPAQVTPALSGLPARSTGFTGRGEALDVLLAQLDPALPASTSRAAVCAVAGLAGVGKTELAVQAAYAALERGWFPGGTLFVDLFGYDQARRVEPGAALDGLLRALGMPMEHIPPETQDRARLYASILAEFAKQGRRVLVVVDNAFSAEQARPLLPTDEATGALVTSRNTLAGLDARLMDLGVLDPQGAVDLMEQAVRTARGEPDPRFKKEQTEALRVAQWCGCLPLALRIVAALLAEDPARPLAAMAADLAQERTRLDELQYAESAVRAAFELSYRHLDPEQARAFRFLPVNPGPDLGFETAAVLLDVDERVARRVLEALARAHLVDRGAAYGRWRMHDLVRVYADELTAAEDDQPRETALDRLLEHYRATAEAADGCLRALPGDPVPDRFRDSADALAWFDQERLSLIAAVSLAAASGRARISIHLTGRLAPFLGLRRHFDEAITIGEIAVIVARAVEDRGNEAAALTNLGNALENVRRFDDAIAVCRQAADIFLELHDRHSAGIALNNLGNALEMVHRFDDAIAVCRQAADIFMELRDRHSAGIALNNLGNALREARRFKEAITAHTHAVAIHRDVGDRDGEGVALTSLGNSLSGTRLFDEAITAYEQALSIYRDLHNRHGEATVLHGLGNALREVHRLDEAISACRQAADIYEELGDRHGEAGAINRLDNALQEMGRFDEASAASRQAAHIYQEVGDRHGEAGALSNLGNALRRAGRFDEAMAASRQAVDMYQRLSDQHGEATALNGLGLVFQEMGRFDEAMAAGRRAADIYVELRDQHSAGIALNNLGNAERKARAAR